MYEFTLEGMWEPTTTIFLQQQRFIDPLYLKKIYVHEVRIKAKWGVGFLK